MRMRYKIDERLWVSLDTWNVKSSQKIYKKMDEYKQGKRKR